MGLYMASFSFLLGDWLGWVVGSELGKNGGCEIWFRYGRVLRKILGVVDGIPLGICDSTVLVSLEGFIDEAVVGKFEGLFIWSWLGSFLDL